LKSCSALSFAFPLPQGEGQGEGIKTAGFTPLTPALSLREREYIRRSSDNGN
jgi:hypothetical protein